MNNNFNLKSFLAEGKLLKEALSVDPSGKLSNDDEDELLSEDEWNEFKNEYNKNFKLNWLIRQLDILDGEEEKTEYAWDYSIPQIENEFKAPYKAAELIFEIFQILKSTTTHWSVGDEGDPKDIQQLMGQEFNSPKSKLLRKLRDDLLEFATPQELIYINPQAWEAMAYLDIDEYDSYVDFNS